MLKVKEDGDLNQEIGRCIWFNGMVDAWIGEKIEVVSGW